jgi:predicted Zn-dependent peptidase
VVERALDAHRTAGERFSIAAGLMCDDGIAAVHHLDKARVREAFDTFYVPANMILVLAGDLSEAGIAAAHDAFSVLPARAAPPPLRRQVQMPDASGFASGWLSGTANLDEPTAFAVVPFQDWQGYYVLQLAQDWLNDRMYRELRSERGIAYTPAAGINYHGTAMSVVMHVQTESADTAFTLDYLRELGSEVRHAGISEEEFEHLRRSTLLGMAQSFETIRDRADYLAASAREIDSGGLFQVDRFYRDLDYATFRTLLARDWPSRFVIVDNSPPVSWSARAALLVFCVGMLLVAGGLLVWRRLRDARPG